MGMASVRQIFSHILGHLIQAKILIMASSHSESMYNAGNTWYHMPSKTNQSIENNLSVKYPNCGNQLCRSGMNPFSRDGSYFKPAVCDPSSLQFHIKPVGFYRVSYLLQYSVQHDILKIMILIEATIRKNKNE
jgi:hypothetical protein